jgi:hypothetical protein
MLKSKTNTSPFAQSPVVPFLLFVPLFLVYWFSAPVGLPEADAGEFAAAALTNGIAHPPGYPLLTMLLAVFSRLSPLLGLVRSLSLFSILCGYCSAVVIYFTLRKLNAGRIVSVVSVYAIFLSADIWRACTTFEPFALNILQASILVFLTHLLACCEINGRGRLLSAAAIGLLFGFGVCNHHSLLLLFPFLLVVFAQQKNDLPRTAAGLFAGFVLGLAPLSYFFFVPANGPVVWGDWQHPWSRLAVHLLRSEYGSLSLSAGSQGSAFYGPGLFLARLPDTLSIVFLAVIFAVAFQASAFLGAKSRIGRNVQLFYLGIAASFILCGIVFPAFFRWNHSPIADMLACRFFSLPTLFLVFPVCLGMSIVNKWLRTRFVRLIVCTIPLLIHAGIQWQLSSRSNNALFSQHIKNVQASVSDNALIIASSDADFMVGRFESAVAEKKGLDFIYVGLQSLPWEQKRVKQLLNVNAGSKKMVLADIVRTAVQTRPVYFLNIPDTTGFCGLLHWTYPVGPLLRVIPVAADQPPHLAVYAKNLELMKKSLAVPTPRQLATASAWDDQYLGYYARTWETIGAALNADKDTCNARVCFTCRDAFRPPHTTSHR